MKQSRGFAWVLVATGLALFAAISYDASLLPQFTGVPVESGEAALVAIVLPMALLLLVFGARGLRRRRIQA